MSINFTKNNTYCNSHLFGLGLGFFSYMANIAASLKARAGDLLSLLARALWSVERLWCECAGGGALICPLSPVLPPGTNGCIPGCKCCWCTSLVAWIKSLGSPLYGGKGARLLAWATWITNIRINVGHESEQVHRNLVLPVCGTFTGIIMTDVELREMTV